MPRARIVRESKIEKTPRVMQLEGMFDVPPSEKSAEAWDINIPIEDRPWNVGLIVGPSGCGKTTVLDDMFADHITGEFEWNQRKSILDGFPSEMGIKDISKLLNSVGFSSPPSWVRPFGVLSNGEKFRVSIARALAESPEIAVIDEFTSVVDRTVAKIGSAAVAKTVRRYDKKLIAAACHYDIEEWLQPDWVFKPHTNEFQWRFLQRRPEIKLEIRKVYRSAWEYFKRYHYLTADISNAAQCFVAYWGDLPVAFFAYLHFMNNRLKKTKKGHRIVTLPDFQGIGIGNALLEHMAACLRGVGFDFIGRTASPQIIRHRAKSKKWKMIRKPEVSINRGGRGKKKSVMHLGRRVATFRYVGAAVDRIEAKEALCIT